MPMPIPFCCPIPKALFCCGADWKPPNAEFCVGRGVEKADGCEGALWNAEYEGADGCEGVLNAEYEGAEGGGGREKELEFEVGMGGRVRDMEPIELCIAPKADGAALELVMLPNAELVLVNEELFVAGGGVDAVIPQGLAVAAPQFKEAF